MSTEAPFLCYRELISSTNIHLSTFFRNNDQEYLFVSTISTISIYLIIRGSTEEVILSLRTQHTLFGRVQDVKFINSNVDNSSVSTFQLTFDKGKFVVISFDPTTSTVSELGIFNAEESAVGTGAEVHAAATGSILYSEPFSDIDPSGSISCNVVYSRHLLFLVLKDLVLPNAALSNLPSSPFLVDLQSQILLPGHIVDMCFLPGYSEPTIALLQATDFVPIGHAKQVMHNCTLSVMAVNTARRSVSLLWQQKQLPHDSLRLVKLTDSVTQGAVAVVTMNALLIANETSVSGVAMNGFARTTVHPRIRLQGTAGVLPSGLELDASRWAECDPLCLAGTLKNGEVVTVQVVLNGKPSLVSASFEVDLIAKGLPSGSCLSVSSDRSLWLLGSRQSDALLLQVNTVHPPPPAEVESITTAPADSVAVIASHDMIEDSAAATTLPAVSGDNSVTPVGPAAKKARRASRFSSAPVDPATPAATAPIVRTAEMIEEEILLYGSAIPSADPLPNWTRGGRKVSLSVVDSIACLGPVTGGLFTSTEGEHVFDRQASFDWTTVKKSVKKLQRPSAQTVAPKDARDCLLLASGVEGDGSLTRVNYGLRLNKLTSREMPTATATISLSIPSANCALLFVSFPSKTRLFRATVNEPTVPSQKEANLANLLFQEVSVSAMGLSAQDDTVAAGLVSSEGRVVVQVSSRGLRMVRLPASFGSADPSADGESVTALQDMVLLDSAEMGGLGGEVGETIVQADIHDGWVSLLTSSRTIHLLRYDASDESLFIEHTGTATTNESEESGLFGAQQSVVTTASSTQISLSTFLSEYTTSVRLYHGVIPHSKGASEFTATSPKLLTSLEVVAAAPVGDEVQAVLSEHDLRAMAAEEIFLYGATLAQQTGPPAAVAVPAPGAVETLAEPSFAPVKATKGAKKETAKAPAKGKGKGKGKAATMDVVEDEEETSVAAVTTAPAPANNSSLESDSAADVAQLYVLITDARGFISALPVSTSSPNSALIINLANAEPLLSFSTFQSEKHSHLLRAKADVQDKLLYDMCLQTLSTRSSELDSLCLVGLFDTGDAVVYFHSAPPAALMSDSKHSPGVFTKVEHTHVSSNRASLRGKRARAALSSGLPETPTTPTASNRVVINWEDVRASRLEYIDQIGSSTGLLLPGLRPLAVVNHRGRPAVLPLSFPELPYANPGTYTLSSLHVLGMSAIVTLWQETASEQTALRRNLGVYYSSADSTIFNDGVAVADKLEVNATVNFISELLPRSDDKTEQALLQKKTYILACSENIKKPFTNNVLTPEEMKVEEESYERFFYDLTSFCQPDTALAPAPLLESPQHKLVLAQNGSAIDEYLLKEDEQVLGLEVLYLTFEKMVDVAPPLPMLGMPFHKPPPVLQPFRRVFIAVSTLVEDKHGEDTQGEGRLLIFSLDYKLFETEAEKAPVDAAPSTDAVENKEESKEEASDAGTISVKKEGLVLSTVITPDTNIFALLPGGGNPPPQAQPMGSSAQTQFLDSIQPKLRLHWQGPGPASAVKQMGQYVISTIGYCVYIYKMNKDSLELEQISFHFAKVHLS